MKYAGIPKSIVRVQGTKLIAQKPLAEKEVKGLLSAGGEPTFRDSINDLFVKSTTFRVSPWWLFWSYILATLGELCLSPVGLSMVSKLAPAKSSTMLMGVWLLTSAFGNFAAGLLGEKLWGTVPQRFGVLLCFRRRSSAGQGSRAVPVVSPGCRHDAWGEVTRTTSSRRAGNTSNPYITRHAALTERRFAR